MRLCNYPSNTFRYYHLTLYQDHASDHFSLGYLNETYHRGGPAFLA